MGKENKEQAPPQTAKENLPNPFDIFQSRLSNPVEDLVGALTPQAQAGSAVVVGLNRVEGLLQTTVSDGLKGAVQAVTSPMDALASTTGELAKSLNPSAGPSLAVEGAVHAMDGLKGAVEAVASPIGSLVSTTGELAKSLNPSTGPSLAIEGVAHAIDGLKGAVQAVTPPTGTLVSTTGELAKSLKSSADLAVGEAVHVIESSVRIPIATASNAVNAAANAATQEIGRRALSFALWVALARLRAIILAYLAKLPIVGRCFVDKNLTGVPIVDTVVTETTPLLGAFRDPKTFATKQAEGLFRRTLYPLLNCLPDVDSLDNAESDDHGLLFKVLIELYVLAKDGGGWLFTHLQEHSLVIAPTVSLGHLSTTDLAASTIGTAVASVTGYSIIQGFVSSLDKVLANAPNRHVAKVACAQAAIVTGIVLFPITHLWTVQSGGLLQRLGQPAEVAVPASQFLQITAAGLPGYAIAEISKRYLASQGLSRVHTRMLSVIAPVNVSLNYLLVDGPIPALRLGFVGAPLCTVLSHNALAVMLIIYIVTRAIPDEVEYLREQNIVPDEPVASNSRTASPTADNHSEVIHFFSGIGGLISAGLSGVAKSATQLWAKDFGGVVACILGPNALATQAVLHTTATTLYQAPKSMSSASENRMKKWITKGDVQRAKIAAAVAFVATLAGVIVIGNILLASASSWGKLFNNDPVIIQSVARLLPVLAAFQAVHGLGAWVDCSLGSLGKTAVFPSINASSDYIIGVPLGVYLALPQHWGLAGVWSGLAISLAYSCLVAVIVLWRTNWRNAVAKMGKKVSRGGEEEVRATTKRRNGVGASV